MLHNDFDLLPEAPDGRRRQLDRDAYYLEIARAVAGRANCHGAKVGAVLVREDRIIGTGYNGTPSGFTNCEDGGCVRCADSRLAQTGRSGEMTDPGHTSGRALDRCICVHGEQNAILTAARFGTRVEGATLYTTHSPCFGCLKEALQAGVERMVYLEEYGASYSEALRHQYQQLTEHLPGGFEMFVAFEENAAPALRPVAEA